MRSMLMAMALLFGCGGSPVEEVEYGEYAPYDAGDTGDTGDTGAEQP